MATTTNYGWTTPDDTALVKDGAAAIRTLGSSVDTTTKNLNPETTLGDISYRSSSANVNTRLPLGTAGQVLKVNSGATAPEWATDASGMTNPMTTTGDTIYSSSGSTPARLAIGSTGKVLTVAGGVPTWATPSSGLSLIQRSSFSNVAGTSTTFDGVFTSTYKSYLVLIESIYSGTDSNDMQMQGIYSGTTQTSGYYGSVVKVDQGGTQTITGQGNTAEMTIGLESGISYDPGSAQIFVNKVGNQSENLMIRGQYMEGANANGYSFTVKSNTARTYTGFLLKSSSTNITGTVAVYGLAI
jgi:hypothetical protein